MQEYYDSFIMGVDLAQSPDFTAITVLGRKIKDEAGRWIPEARVLDPYMKYLVFFDLRLCERLPLGTTYPEVIERLKAVVNSGEMFSRSTMVVDATGVGLPVFQELVKEKPCKMVGVQITGGSKVTEDKDAEVEFYNVPKMQLVSALQVLIQGERLKIAPGLEFSDTLKDEILNFRVKVTESANVKLEAWRENQHDDLVLSLALAAWYGLRSESEVKTMEPWGTETQEPYDPLSFGLK
jgi:hypothetical protein